MTLDELLADLRAKHGEQWIHAACIMAAEGGLTPSSLMTIQQRQLASELWDWLRSMVAAGVAATLRPELVEGWQPGPEMWSSVPEWAQWIAGDSDSELDAWEKEPKMHADCFWVADGRREVLESELPLGVDWRQAIWRRPE